MAASEHLQDQCHQPSTVHPDSSSNHVGPRHPLASPAAQDAASEANVVPPSPSRNDAMVCCSANNKRRKNKKRVSWDRIHTREFALVVGDHPMCQDGLPVSLGWQYNDYSCSEKHMTQQNGATNQQISERRQSYVFPRRLSYEERRERLISVSNLTSDQIQNDEIDLAVRALSESLETQYVDGNYISDDVIMTPVQTDLNPLINEDLMELDVEVVPGIDGQELVGDITNFEWG